MTDRDFYCESVLSGRLSVQVIRETDRVLAFRHTNPAWETHIVVIPKEHVRQLVDVADPTLIGELFALMSAIIREYGWHESGYKIITNGGVYQSTPHLHFHLVAGTPLDPHDATQAGELLVEPLLPE